MVGTRLDEFTAAPLQLYRRLIDHHQLRWLHDGVFPQGRWRCVECHVGSLGEILNQPLWKLLDLELEFVADCIDWRNLGDALTREEAIALLQARRAEVPQREAAMATRGPKAYCTAGWLGLSDEEILATIRKLQAEGFDAFKLKVGQDSAPDVARIRFMRDSIGPDSQLMGLMPTNTGDWPEAKQHIEQYQPFGLKWIEEPIARDDVLGYVELAETFADASFDFACGEQAASPVIFKQLLKSGAIRYCQIDAVRVAGVNDVMAIILLAAKYGVPVCPHGGGIALCNMIQHYGMWDQIAVAGHSDTQLVEYIDFLQDTVEHPWLSATVATSHPPLPAGV